MNRPKHPWRYLAIALTTALLLIIVSLPSPISALSTAHSSQCSGTKVNPQFSALTSHSPQSPLAKGGSSGPPPWQGGVRGGALTGGRFPRDCTQSPLAKGRSPVLPFSKGELEGVSASWYPDSGWAPQKETLAPLLPLSQSLRTAFPAGHWEREKRGVGNTPPPPLKRGAGSRQGLSTTLQSPSLEGLGVGLPPLEGLGVGLPSLEEPEVDLVANLTTVDDYLDQGQALYDAGRFVEAIVPWQQALILAEQRHDVEGMAIAHNYLAVGHQALSEWDTAQHSVDQGIQTLTAPPLPLRLRSGQAHSPNQSFLLAQLLTTQGNGKLQMGDADAALQSWQQAEAIYASLDATGPLIRVRINQSQALRTLGFYRQAKETLEDINHQLDPLPDSLLKLKGLQSLGQTLYRVGDLNQANAVLTRGLAIAYALNHPIDVTSIQLHLAQTLVALGETEQALNLYRQVQQSENTAIALDASLHTLALEMNRQDPDWSIINAHISSLYPHLTHLPASRWGIHSQVYFAQLLIDVLPHSLPNSLADGPSTDTDPDPLQRLHLTPHSIAQLLAISIQQAEQLGDRQATVAALGQLGHLYEQTQQWPAALELTDQALNQDSSPYLTYEHAQLQWQKGRILKAQHQTEKALNTYQSAVQTLNTLRHDLVAMNPNLQYSFRDQVEPIYRDFVQVLLSDLDTLPTNTQQNRLERSRTVIESLKLAELENFFREACLTDQTRSIDKIDPNAAVIYPIFLDQRLEVILSLPNQSLHHYGVDLAATDNEDLFEIARSALHPLRSNTAIVPIGQQLYDWLIRPAEEVIVKTNIKTLVFVPDGFLRNIPMSVLHDGDRFLIETYNVALAPGMQLLNSQPIESDTLTVLTAGLTDARQGFEALPGVEAEIDQIQQLVTADVLLNDTFTKANVLETLNDDPFSVIHLATHGQFGPSAEETFLLTWDEHINVEEFDRLFQPTHNASHRESLPLELLVLSACQTAEGDSRSALGMAGVAVRSGARSTIATLWSVQDESTSMLMTEFYRLLAEENLPRADALRQAQLFLLQHPRYQHPYYWAPFVLIGNWQ